MSGDMVLDASVLINVLGSGEAAAVLGALPGRVVVPDVTSREVLRDPFQGQRRGDPLAPLLAEGLLERRRLEGRALNTFMSLVGADPPDDLGDGEAAAIALADEFGLIVGLDDAKARRIAGDRFRHLSVVSSVGLFATPALSEVLGGMLPDLVFSALLHTRMRVLRDEEEWVLSLIGDRASHCPSLRRRR